MTLPLIQTSQMSVWRPATMNFRVYCPHRNIEDQHLELAIGAEDTVQELKQLVCSCLGVDPGAMQMFALFRTWDASARRHKHSLLDDYKLDHYLWQANVRNGQQLLIQRKVLRVTVWCSTPQWGSKDLFVPAMDSLQQLKAEAATKFGLFDGSCELWGYCMGRKQLCLEDRLQQTLIAANVWDGRKLLLEQKVPQQPQQQQQQTQQTQQQIRPIEQELMMESQQLTRCSPREEQLVHALLEYLSSPAEPTLNSCEEQLAELLSRALELQQQACNKGSSSTIANQDIAATDQCHHQCQQGSDLWSSTAVGGAKEAEELQRLRTCVVCFDRPRSVMLLPCKHLALCDNCSQQLRNQARNSSSSSLGQLQTPCPVCRASAYHHMPGVILS